MRKATNSIVENQRLFMPSFPLNEVDVRVRLEREER